MKHFLDILREFVSKKSNHVTSEEAIETFRNTFIDFVYVFTYYHDVMHLESDYMDDIKKKIVSDNPRFLNTYNPRNTNYLMRFIREVNDNNNRYNEFYFNKYQTIPSSKEVLHTFPGLSHLPRKV